MLCQECNKKPATVHMIKVINGVKNEFHLCEQCARQKEGLGMNDGQGSIDTPFSLLNIFEGFIDFPGSGTLPYKTQRQVRCPSCNLEYEEFKKTGRLGCSECYKAFGDRLEPVLKRIHGSTQHTGKVPKRTGGIIRVKRDIERLKYDLKRAIENEEYEKAAELRDRIKVLEGSDSGM